MLRLSPLFPLAFFSYILGVTSVTFYDYVLGTTIGLFPGVVAFSYMAVKMENISNNGLDPVTLISIIGTFLSIFVISYKAK